METETTQPTARQVLTQAAAGAAAGLLVGIAIMSIYRWLWHVEISLNTIMLLSIGFSIYCGVLSAWLGKRFWNLLGTFLSHIS
ncbi:MAG: hypothetical protein F6J94_13955 [Moorea sp. SIO1F2]|uniref:Uncharacterized protein n=1 Tax=Moorena bouillonii PNG TaxID=568701 RepID=A0A1U7N9Z1_9CYAN|nr:MULTISPECIES: hypothetical protein [Moorena]NEO67640.1 hypothetical protein [Moorena sp. SIO4G2]NEO21621.1 hypothetical protein [Moorena sp. SIO4A5]NEP24113.1 hypothetical protein [Moorena sp. SIO3I6]NEQ59204.1 hypothetical protein [Moorena sp. SIO4A1]NET82991.1 hypothetical protein [Moorena sp. SIO1F2]